MIKFALRGKPQNCTVRIGRDPNAAIGVDTQTVRRALWQFGKYMAVNATAVIFHAMGNNMPPQAVAMINGLPVGRKADAIGQADIIIEFGRNALAFDAI